MNVMKNYVKICHVQHMKHIQRSVLICHFHIL